MADGKVECGTSPKQGATLGAPNGLELAALPHLPVSSPAMTRTKTHALLLLSALVAGLASACGGGSPPPPADTTTVSIQKPGDPATPAASAAPASSAPSK